MAHENRRLFVKLIEADTRQEDNSSGLLHRKHHNSYFREKEQAERIRNENYDIIKRLLNQTGVVPYVSSMKKEYK